VETAEDLNTLQALGVQRMQGYYLKAPAPRDDMFDWLETADVGQTMPAQS
jgi:EAL domain-containing protein (putative c-di-GMP-specific phosphodiesterase class I)